MKPFDPNRAARKAVPYMRRIARMFAKQQVDLLKGRTTKARAKAKLARDVKAEFNRMVTNCIARPFVRAALKQFLTQHPNPPTLSS